MNDKLAKALQEIDKDLEELYQLKNICLVTGREHPAQQVEKTIQKNLEAKKKIERLLLN